MQDEEEEDEGEEGEEEEEEEEAAAAPREPKRKKSAFIDDAAQSDDDDEVRDPPRSLCPRHGALSATPQYGTRVVESISHAPVGCSCVPELVAATEASGFAPRSASGRACFGTAAATQRHCLSLHRRVFTWASAWSVRPGG